MVKTFDEMVNVVVYEMQQMRLENTISFMCEYGNSLKLFGNLVILPWFLQCHNIVHGMMNRLKSEITYLTILRSSRFL